MRRFKRRKAESLHPGPGDLDLTKPITEGVDRADWAHGLALYPAYASSPAAAEKLIAETKERAGRLEEAARREGNVA